MSYFKGLKLTKKGEQLQAKINGNLSETLVFTRAEVGSGELTNDDELRFLTALKSSWGNAVISKCELQGEEQTRVAIELQFNNAELTEDKIFREIGLFARGNDGQEVLYAYSNAAEQYDYIPQMKDSPHTFIITIYFYITNGTKVDANIDLNSYISLKKFNEEMAKKANKTDRANENNYGLVKYGTEENTALEGDKINQIVGKDYGGVLNTPGEKYEGKVYYDRNTKKLFLCKRNNSDISANINNYIGLDNNSLLDRLENLFSFNLIKSSQNKGYKFYTKNSYIGNYIDVSDTFSSVDFCLISPARAELTDAEARFINYQGFDGSNILINAIWITGNSLEKKYNPVASNNIYTASCTALVYGTLK